MSGTRCEDCGWAWPLPGRPPAGAECDNCGGQLLPEYDAEAARLFELERALVAREEQRRALLAVAGDLYRDMRRIAGIIARLRSAGIEELVVIAPARGGKLNGGTFLGLPVVEGDVKRCMVAVGAPDPAPVVADTTEEWGHLHGGGAPCPVAGCWASDAVR